MRIKKVKRGMQLPKRTYLEGVYFDTDCPKCGSKCSRDFGDHYLSYPVIGSYEEFFMYCYKCDHEWEAGEIKVDLTATIKEVDENE